MSNRHKLPALPQITARSGLGFEIPPQALSRWDSEIRAAASTDDSVISILDPIGADFFGNGVTARRISAALRSIGANPVTVHINSPGGDFFEGLAIYNLLRAHSKDVTVKVLGVAASAASIIAMAGDRIEVPLAGFLMIHNAWVMAVGDRNDLRDFADTLDQFDSAIASVYAARTSKEPKAIGKMMDKETWIGGQDAIDQGFADALLPADQAVKKPANPDDAKPSARAALEKLQLILAQAKIPRAERRQLIADAIEAFSGKPSAAEDDMPGAVVDAALLSVLSGIEIPLSH